jgi:hypothetical protein
MPSSLLGRRRAVAIDVEMSRLGTPRPRSRGAPATRKSWTRGADPGVNILTPWTLAGSFGGGIQLEAPND